MKRLLLILFTCLLLCSLAACGNNTGSADEPETSSVSVDSMMPESVVADGLENPEEDPMESSELEADKSVQADSSESEEETPVHESQTSFISVDDIPSIEELNESIDEDLTAFEGAVLYAAAYNMCSDPDPHLNKCVRVEGQFAVAYNSLKNVYYPAVVVSDDLACCQQGIEFVWLGHNYPDGYPELGTKITVTGIFEIYEEDGWQTPHLICPPDMTLIN